MRQDKMISIYINRERFWFQKRVQRALINGQFYIVYNLKSNSFFKKIYKRQSFKKQNKQLLNQLIHINEKTKESEQVSNKENN